MGGLAGGLRWTDIQQYSLSCVSFVPSGGGICLQKYLKVRQERVSEPLLCCDNKEQTFITPEPDINMRTLCNANLRYVGTKRRAVMIP